MYISYRVNELGERIDVCRMHVQKIIHVCLLVLYSTRLYNVKCSIVYRVCNNSTQHIILYKKVPEITDSFICAYSLMIPKFVCTNRFLERCTSMHT